MKNYILLLFLCISVPAAAQYQELLPDALKIKRAYDELIKDTHAPITQMQYVRVFPATKKKFLEIFYPPSKEQLYETRAQYLEALKGISGQYPKEVMPVAIKIGKDLKGSGDITGQLQFILLDVAVRETNEFIIEIKKLKKKEQDSLAMFLAYANSPQYIALLENLQKENAHELVGIFIKAMETTKNAVNE